MSAAAPFGDGVEDAFDLAGEVAFELVLPDAEDRPSLAAELRDSCALGAGVTGQWSAVRDRAAGDEKRGIDRDMKAADAYVRRLDQAGKVSDLCGRGADGDVLRAMLQEAYLQGWHAAMVARDQDDVNGVCQECGGTIEKHDPMCSQR